MREAPSRDMLLARLKELEVENERLRVENHTHILLNKALRSGFNRETGELETLDAKNRRLLRFAQITEMLFEIYDDGTDEETDVAAQEYIDARQVLLDHGDIDEYVSEEDAS